MVYPQERMVPKSDNVLGDGRKDDGITVIQGGVDWISVIPSAETRAEQP